MTISILIFLFTVFRSLFQDNSRYFKIVCRLNIWSIFKLLLEFRSWKYWPFVYFVLKNWIPKITECLSDWVTVGCPCTYSVHTIYMYIQCTCIIKFSKICVYTRYMVYFILHVDLICFFRTWRPILTLTLMRNHTSVHAVPKAMRVGRTSSLTARISMV